MYAEALPALTKAIGGFQSLKHRRLGHGQRSEGAGELRASQRHTCAAKHRHAHRAKKASGSSAQERGHCGGGAAGGESARA